jgi:hypothetical protein
MDCCTTCLLGLIEIVLAILWPFSRWRCRSRVLVGQLCRSLEHGNVDLWKVSDHCIVMEAGKSKTTICLRSGTLTVSGSYIPLSWGPHRRLLMAAKTRAVKHALNHLNIHCK